VRRADARSAQIDGPDSISHRFQVSAYSGEPVSAKAACNLLSSDCWRAALSDEPKEGWPKVSLVAGAALPPCRAEGLARAASGPEGLVVRPSSQSSCEGPSTDPREKMALREFSELIGLHLLDASLVDDAGRNVAGINQVSQPLGCIRVNFVVISK
jgi:hypothetical protein